MYVLFARELFSWETVSTTLCRRSVHTSGSDRGSRSSAPRGSRGNCGARTPCTGGLLGRLGAARRQAGQSKGLLRRCAECAEIQGTARVKRKSPDSL